VGETLALQNGIDQVVAGRLTDLSDEQLTDRINAVQAQLDALNGELTRRSHLSDGTDC
jgi:hypothetical protein